MDLGAFRRAAQQLIDAGTPTREQVDAYLAAGTHVDDTQPTVTATMLRTAHITKHTDELHQAICAGTLSVAANDRDRVREGLTWPWTRTHDIGYLCTRMLYRAACRAARSAAEADQIAVHIAARGEYDGAGRALAERLEHELGGATILVLGYDHSERGASLDWLAGLSERAHREALGAIEALGSYYGTQLVDTALTTPEQYDTHGRHVRAATLHAWSGDYADVELCASAARHWATERHPGAGRTWAELLATWAGTLGELDDAVATLVSSTVR